MKKILFFLLLFSAPCFAQEWFNDTLRVGYWHGSKIDTAYLNMTELSAGSGTVTSVGLTGNNGISIGSSPITGAGTMTVGITNGSLGDSLMATTYLKASNNLSDIISQSSARTNLSLNNVENTALSTWLGTTNITTLGTIATGVWSATAISISSGGTGQITANAAINALLPSQVGNANKLLQTNGTSASWAALNPLTATAIDLNNVWTVHDDATHHAGVLISATSKPGSPQVADTIQNSDIPSNANVTDYMVIFSISGKNTDASTRNLNWRFTLNGTDIGSADNTLSPTTASPYWRANGCFAALAINAGDVVGIKLWASVTNVVDYRDFTIYIVPRQFNIAPTANTMALIMATSTSFSMSGANPGVTYTANALSSSVSHVISDGRASILPPMTAGGSMVIYPLTLSFIKADNNNYGTPAIAAAQTLLSINQIPRFFYQWLVQ